MVPNMRRPRFPNTAITAIYYLIEGKRPEEKSQEKRPSPTGKGLSHAKRELSEFIAHGQAEIVGIAVVRLAGVGTDHTAIIGMLTVIDVAHVDVHVG